MKRRRKNKKQLRWVLPVITVLFLAVFCYAGFRWVKDIVSNIRDRNGISELKSIVAQSEQAAPTPTPMPTVTSQPSADSPVEETPAPSPTQEPEPTPLPKYAQLYAMNNEFFGWLKDEGLGIDYPVMYNYDPYRRDYYLNRDFNGKYSDAGLLYIDNRCPADGNYYLIYGHLMVNKSMFGRLPEYASVDCWQENPIIYFDTVYEEREYAVMSCFYGRLYGEYEQGFRFYQYFDLTDEAVFNEYVAQAKAAALYDTGIDAEYGDELLVLSTCSHHVDDGRFVVVAKRIK